MDRLIRRGEIWSYEFKPPDRRRPVLILSRSKAIAMLNTVIVAPITSTIHGSVSEVIVGIDQGLKNTSAIKLDNIQTIEKSKLIQFVGTLDSALMKKVCHALSAATGCIEES
jgi:mRNA interferase MazF